MTAHALDADRYQSIPASRVLPGIDLDLLCKFIDRPTAGQAIREYRAALASK